MGAYLFSSKTPWCLSVCFCVCPHPNCSSACLSSAHSFAYIQSTFLGHALCTLMGLSCSQNAAAIFSHVANGSRKLPTRLSGSPRAKGGAGAPTPWPSPGDWGCCCSPLALPCGDHPGWTGSARPRRNLRLIDTVRIAEQRSRSVSTAPVALHFI